MHGHPKKATQDVTIRVFDTLKRSMVTARADQEEKKGVPQLQAACFDILSQTLEASELRRDGCEALAA